MKSSRVRAFVVVSVLMCALAACGGKDGTANELPTTTPQLSTPTTSTSTSSVKSTPTPTAEPTRTITKYGDLTLDLRQSAKVDTKAKFAVGRFLQLQQFFAAMATGGAAPVELPVIATSGVIDTLNGMLAPQRKAKERAAGTLVVRVTEAQAGTGIAIVEGCFDQSKVVMIRPDGSRYVDATVKKHPTAVVRITVVNSSGVGQVTEFSFKGKTC